MKVLNMDRRQYPYSVYYIKDHIAPRIRRMENHKAVHEPNESYLIHSCEQILEEPMPWSRPDVTEVGPCEGAHQPS